LGNVIDNAGQSMTDMVMGGGIKRREVENKEQRMKNEE